MMTISFGGWFTKFSERSRNKCSGSKQNVAARVINLPGTKQVISVQFGSLVFIESTVNYTLRHYLSYPSDL